MLLESHVSLSRRLSAGKERLSRKIAIFNAVGEVRVCFELARVSFGRYGVDKKEKFLDPSLQQLKYFYNVAVL